MADDTKVKLFNRSQRFIDSKEGRIKPGSLVSLSTGEAARLMKLYKDDLQDLESATDPLKGVAQSPEKMLVQPNPKPPARKAPAAEAGKGGKSPLELRLAQEAETLGVTQDTLVKMNRVNELLNKQGLTEAEADELKKLEGELDENPTGK